MNAQLGQTRGRLMASVKSKDTSIELLIRRELFARGFRYRLHSKHLPGTPDLYLAKFKTALFVHGCFWHAHGCHLFRWPKTNMHFWRTKLEGNKARDCAVAEALQAAGVRCLVIWECSMRGKSDAERASVWDQVAAWLHSKQAYGTFP